jgi:hypothetical protein
MDHYSPPDSWNERLTNENPFRLQSKRAAAIAGIIRERVAEDNATATNRLPSFDSTLPKRRIFECRCRPRARRGASTAEPCPQTDVLSVVRKSRNSSVGLYRRRRRSAHDRCRANAIRFLMNTLLALSAPQSIHAYQQNSLWMRLGYADVFVPSAKPSFRHPGLLARHNYSARTFGTSSILLLKAAATAIHSLAHCSAAVSTPSLTVLFPCVEQRQG